MVRVRDLRSLTGTDGPHELLYCRHCNGEYSANRGDYFLAPPHHVFRCCGRPMIRAIRTTSYREVRS